MSLLEKLKTLKIKDYLEAKIPIEDPLIFGIKNKMHIEIPLEKRDGYTLITPQLNIIRNDENEEISSLLREKPEIFQFLRVKMIETACFNSSIFESNSYYIIQNGYLVIGRLKRLLPDNETFEIKFYTISKIDIVKNYTDKIYIGGTFLNFKYPKMLYGGLNFYIDSLYDQLETLKFKAKTKLKNKNRYKNTFFLEIEELVRETIGKSISDLSQISFKRSVDKIPLKDCPQVLVKLRDMKHYFLELSDEVSEFENVLRIDGEENFARYVTKFKKDLKNIINYINFSLISPIYRRITKSNRYL